jgi:hypothetical protein
VDAICTTHADPSIAILQSHDHHQESRSPFNTTVEVRQCARSKKGGSISVHELVLLSKEGAMQTELIFFFPGEQAQTTMQELDRPIENHTRQVVAKN